MYQVLKGIIDKQQQPVIDPKTILPGRAEAGKVVNNTTQEKKKKKVEIHFLGQLLEC